MLKTERMDRVRAALRAQGLTQMIVCDPKSVWYLTGVAVEPYERLLALYLPTEGEPVLFLNRLFNVPEPPCRTVWHTDTDKPVAQIAEVVDAGRPLGIDKEWPAKFLIPLMVRLVNLSDTLALSVETRGFTTYPAPYTIYRPVHLQAKDGAFAVLSALCAMGAVLL